MSIDEPSSFLLDSVSDSAGLSYKSYESSDLKILRHNHHSNNQHAFAFSTYEYENRSWLKTIIDSSHLITFCISITVIIYGSFRSLNIDSNDSENNLKKETNHFNQENDDNLDDSNHEDDEDNEYSFFLNDDFNNESNQGKKNRNNSAIQTIDSIQALFIPVIASMSLLLMFFYFESIQTAFVICTSILAIVAFSYLLSPICKIILKAICSNHEMINKKRTCFLLGKHRLPDLFAFIISIILVFLWIITGHWILMDIIGIGFCVTFIAIVRLPSLKVSILLLVGLVVYDVIWVYFSHFIFNSNVMVKVATREAENPVGLLARKLNIKIRESPKLSLPGKLVIPSYQRAGNFSILGLGDIVVPGLLLCFVLRFDAYKKSQIYQFIIPDNSINENEQNVNKSQTSYKFNKDDDNKKKFDYHSQSSSNDDKYHSKLRKFLTYPIMISNVINYNKKSNNSTISYGNYSIKNLIRFNNLSYFHCSLIGYFVGLITATLSSEIFREAQPALLFLVPFTLLPLLIMGYLKGDLHLMWNEPFNFKTAKYFYV